jgi:hypothetical protein
VIKKIFTVYDEKSEAFLQPFFLDTNGQAIRAITDCVNDLNHQFGKHPSDHTLFSLGTFDDSDGTFQTSKVSLGCLVEFKTPMEIDDNKLSLVKEA